MTGENKNNGQPKLRIQAGAWIGISGLALTIILALFGAAAWIVTRIDRVDTRIDRVEAKIDNLDTRVDALAMNMARMSSQLDLILQEGLTGPKDLQPRRQAPAMASEVRRAPRLLAEILAFSEEPETTT